MVLRNPDSTYILYEYPVRTANNWSPTYIIWLLSIIILCTVYIGSGESRVQDKTTYDDDGGALNKQRFISPWLTSEWAPLWCCWLAGPLTINARRTIGTIIRAQGRNNLVHVSDEEMSGEVLCSTEHMIMWFCKVHLGWHGVVLTRTEKQTDGTIIESDIYVYVSNGCNVEHHHNNNKSDWSSLVGM